MIDEGTAYGLAAATHDPELTEVGANTPMGELLRRYWHPIGLAADAGRAAGDEDGLALQR